MARRDPVPLVLLGGMLVCLLALPVLGAASNRLVSARPLGLVALYDGWGWALPAAVAAVALARRPWVVLAVAVLLLSGLVGFAGWRAAGLVAARVSPGLGFWAALILAGLFCAHAARGVTSRLAMLAVVGPPVLLLASGRLDALGPLQEYMARRGVFWAALLKHCEIVAATMALTLAVAVPLGLLAQRRLGWRGKVFPVLNLLQTIPSLALFGLLLAPLAALGRAVPGLGISGVGWAPTLVALTLYSLLVPVRAVVAGLDGVPAALRDAAAGMGMTRRQVLLELELPLALPVFLSGLRVAAVQAVGLAAVAALIGAGGLGAIVFDGLYADALDLVMLGVVPMALLALAIDSALRVAEAASRVA